MRHKRNSVAKSVPVRRARLRKAAARRLTVRDLSPEGRIAVIDIGSNTVRLVVYDTPTRLPVPMFNEKAQCALAKGLARTGRLNPNGRTEALAALARFIHLARAMGVERLDLVATAAVREAKDGREFVSEIERRFGVSVQVPSGAEEARLAALGLLSGVPAADGLVGDLGGGSLDLVVVDKGRFRQSATFPFGHLLLPETAGDGIGAARRMVAESFFNLRWIGRIKGRTLYACGGSWRTVARMFIEQTKYPLHVIDNYDLDAHEARRLADVIARLSPATLAKMTTIPSRRAETLPYAALVLSEVIAAASPKRVVFSGFGMREGKLLTSLPLSVRRQDPLLSGAAMLAERGGRFFIGADEIDRWLAPLFPGDGKGERRLRRAAALLSDLGWTEHPDYRGEHAFHRVLRLPFAGLTHADRVYLALAVFVRYNGSIDSPVVAPVIGLLENDAREKASVLGLALRLAHTISGGAPGILGRTRFRIGKNALILQVPKDRVAFAGETVERRLKTLGRAIGKEGRVG